ncbi:copper amine oxidase [Alkalibacillus sp. S2W]|uniref:copper amine oxidase n=1 Tax=Alkalibacillus sp. S2W TaxID=3386553 RepID=UPI00398D0DB0
MNWKRGLMVVPLAVSLVIPGTMTVNADDHNSQKMEPTVQNEAIDLRTTLDHYLSEHAFLAVEAMRKGADGAEDYDAIVAALNENTEDLTGAIESVYGEDAGQQFNQMWSDHIGFFVDYVMATAEEDEEGKQAALDELAQYKNEFSKFLETATGERLEAESLAEGLQMHVNQLIGAFDAYVAGDYETAYEYEREAIGHMYMVSKGLSTAIADQFPDKFNEMSPATAAADFRSDLNNLLSEHAGLAVMTMQNGIDGSEDFDASAAALSNNTDDLAAAISSIYGEEAGQQFKEMWAAHIGNFVEYVQATGAEDEEAKQAALDALDQYRTDFSTFLENATDERLESDALAEGLQMHVNQLIGAFDNYVAGEYEMAYDKTREAYAHMFNPAEGLSTAFVDQFPEKFQEKSPSEMPKTGLAPADEGMSALGITALVGILVAIVATGFYIRRSEQ